MTNPRTLTSKDTFDEYLSDLIDVNVTATNNHISDELPELSQKDLSELIGRMTREMITAFRA